jgi:hypothetical protein
MIYGGVVPSISAINSLIAVSWEFHEAGLGEDTHQPVVPDYRETAKLVAEQIVSYNDV